MNHIYRIVWNTAFQAWVAVAENARGRGKSHKSARPAIVLIAAAFGVGIAAAQVLPPTSRATVSQS